jgi:outer membrane lipoprotein-sorting protein
VKKSILVFSAALALSMLLSGCSLLPSTRKLPIPKAPSIVQTAAPVDLVAHLNQHWAALQSLTATVEIQASEIRSKEGISKRSPTFHGHILMRKPEMLRVFGTYLGIKAFDTSSNGKDFTLYMPTRSKVVRGADTLKKKSINAVENLRPGFFMDALAVRGLEPGDEYGVTAETDTVQDAARKHLYLLSEYKLSVWRSKPGSYELTPVCVIFFNREDFQPYEQDIYGANGNLETEIFYTSYKDFSSGKYPSIVTIKRPMEELEIVLTVDDVKENVSLTDDQFQIKIPEGTQVQKLE